MLDRFRLLGDKIRIFGKRGDGDCKEEAYNYDTTIDGIIRFPPDAKYFTLRIDTLTAYHPDSNATSILLPLSYDYLFQVASDQNGYSIFRDDSDSLEAHLSAWLLDDGYFQRRYQMETSR